MTAVAFPVAKIGDFASKVESWNPKREGKSQEISYIDLGAIDNDKKTIIGFQKVNANEAPSRARQLVKVGDVLVSTVRPNLNGVARVPANLDCATASTGFCVLRPDPEKLHPDYLFQWVKSPDFVADMIRKATGQSYPAVSDKIIFNSEIPLPPLDEQKRIAVILDQSDALRRMRQSTLNKLNALGKSIFYEMFGDPKSNPKNLPKTPLSELIKVSSGEGLTAENMRPGPYPVFGGNGVNGYHDEFRVGAGTIIIGRVGVYCGAVHVTDTDSWVTDNALVVFKKQDISTAYLAEALKHANLNQYAGRSAQPLVSGSRIYPVEILLPAKITQLEFEKKVSAYGSQIEKQHKALDKLSSLFAALQQRAFRGEL